MKAVRFHQHGGPEVLIFEDAPEPTDVPAVPAPETMGTRFRMR